MPPTAPGETIAYERRPTFLGVKVGDVFVRSAKASAKVFDSPAESLDASRKNEAAESSSKGCQMLGHFITGLGDIQATDNQLKWNMTGIRSL